jgi:hypothetical protein
MHVSTTQVLRKFAQKMAAQNKQANTLASIGSALSDPKTLGTIAGAGGLGLGAYGLANMMQSDEDRERGSWMPTLAGLAGVLGGGYAGSQLGPQLAEMLRKTPDVTPVDGLKPKSNGSINYNPKVTYEDAVANALTPANSLPIPKDPTKMPLSAAPKKIGTPPQSYSDFKDAVGAEGGEPPFVPPAANVAKPRTTRTI